MNAINNATGKLSNQRSATKANDEPMTTEYRIYPSHCHVLSPTIAKWVPLKISDVLRLKQVAGYEGQNIYHSLNHPIQWVKLTGIVVAIDEFYNRICYTLDDSSGHTIECVCLAPPKSDTLPKESNKSYSTSKFWNDARANKAPAEAPVDLKAITNMISPDGPKLEDIDVGSVVKIKGIIGVFRDVRQIAMKIIHVIPDTAAEVVEWRARNAFYKDVLSKPWVVTEEQEKTCLRDAEREKWREEEKRKRRIKKDETEEERKARKKRERRERREKEAKEAKETEQERKREENKRGDQW